MRKLRTNESPTPCGECEWYSEEPDYYEITLNVKGIPHCYEPDECNCPHCHGHGRYSEFKGELKSKCNDFKRK
jgi:hypothetical protein